MKWRVGNKLGRTLYRDDILVGMLDNADLARAVVDVLNETIAFLAFKLAAKQLRASAKKPPPLCTHPWRFRESDRAPWRCASCDKKIRPRAAAKKGRK